MLKTDAVPAKVHDATAVAGELGKAAWDMARELSVDAATVIGSTSAHAAQAAAELAASKAESVRRAAKAHGIPAAISSPRRHHARRRRPRLMLLAVAAAAALAFAAMFRRRRHRSDDALPAEPRRADSPRDPVGDEMHADDDKSAADRAGNARSRGHLAAS